MNTDWQPLLQNIQYSDNRVTQTLKFTSLNLEHKEDVIEKMEHHFKEELSQFRKDLGNPTIFNRQVMLILKKFLFKVHSGTNIELNRKRLRQLHRAYYTHGFILKLMNGNLKDISKLLFATKIHTAPGPVEFGLACSIQNHIGNIRSIWLGVVVLKSRN